MKVLPVCILGALSLGVSIAAAQDIPALQTDRPDETESSAVVPAGFGQIEAGLGYQDHHTPPEGEPNAHRSFAAPSVLVRYGALPWLELRGSGESSLHIQEFADTKESDLLFEWGVGAKIQILGESGWAPEMAFIGELAFPDGEGVAPGFRLAMSHTLSPSLGFGYNIGAEFDTDAPTFSRSVTGIYTAALGMDITESLGAYIEVFGSLYDGEGEHLVDGGITYALGPNLQFDAAIGAGISENAPGYYVNTGLSVRLPR